MTIIIKEIKVRAVVERESSQYALNKESLWRIKNEIYNQLKEELETEDNKRRNRR